MTTLRLLPLLAMLLALACKEPCDKTDCGEFSSCSNVDDEAVCICDLGYEKDDDGKCNVRTTLKFNGDWAVSEVRTDNANQTKQTLTYDMRLADTDSPITRMFLTGLGDYRCPDGNPPVVEATISASSLIIDAAAYCPDAVSGFSGYLFERSTGRINTSKDTITLAYRVTWSNPPAQFDFSGALTMVRK
ncbi:MAG: hypothetical protein OHK0039_07190 [Bacteroidia bacterium]